MACSSKANGKSKLQEAHLLRAHGTKPSGNWKQLSHWSAALWKPSIAHLFLTLVLGLQDEWDEDVDKWQGQSLSLGHCYAEFRQQSSWGTLLKGVERDLRQWVLWEVPLVPRGETGGSATQGKGNHFLIHSKKEYKAYNQIITHHIFDKRNQQWAFQRSSFPYQVVTT